MLSEGTIRFLKQLKKNNHREWFERNRKNYEAAREEFTGLVKLILEAHGKKDPDISHLTPKDCIFRINRDVRFSKDKSPYKPNFGASFSRGGKKSIFAGYYFHLEPGNSFAGGGLWMPEAERVKKLRQEIDYNFESFQKIIKGKRFVAEYGDLEKTGETSLSREPKGYTRENPAIDYLKLKSWIALKKIGDADLTRKDLPQKILSAFQALQPLIKFINSGIEDMAD
jgi:uncharacterized protein (TIGR02453 family)